MIQRVEVDHVRGDRFEITVGRHVLHVDQPCAEGGEDSAPTPTELFVAALASCVAFYVRRYLTRHGLPTTGLRVEASAVMAQRPARVAEIDLQVRVPAAVPEERMAGLLAVASHCTVHNTLDDPPVVRIRAEPASPTSMSA
ncbi:MAG: OsmC family protein [Acidimicrobiales bacterium]